MHVAYVTCDRQWYIDRMHFTTHTFLVWFKGTITVNARLYIPGIFESKVAGTYSGKVSDLNNSFELFVAEASAHLSTCRREANINLCLTLI